MVSLKASRFGVGLDFEHRFIIIKPKEVYAAGTDLKAAAKVLYSIESVNDTCMFRYFYLVPIAKW